MNIRTGDIALDKPLHETVFESIGIGIMVTDLASRLLFINKAAEDMWDLPREQALGQSFLLALAEHERARMKKTFDYVVRTGRSVHAREIHYISHAGKNLIINAYASLFTYPAEKTLGVVMWMEDITETLKLQQELQRADKLAALGQLALGIAHEIRTPLATIKALASLIRSDFDNTPNADRYFEIILSEINRLDKLSRELLNFGGKRHMEIEPVNINDLLRRIIHLVRLNTSQKIRFYYDLEESLPPVYGDRQSLMHVMTNIIINAVEAIPEEGIIRVETRRDDGFLIITVQDTGTGILPEHIDKIFDPLFTTKENGTGLGLSMAHSIISDHGGEIKVQSKPNEGTSFTVLLPLG